MCVGGLIAWFSGVSAERRPLEDVAAPLSEMSKLVGGKRITCPSPA
jgi:hypothetical protein